MTKLSAAAAAAATATTAVNATTPLAVAARTSGPAATWTAIGPEVARVTLPQRSRTCWGVFTVPAIPYATAAMLMSRTPSTAIRLQVMWDVEQLRDDERCRKANRQSRRAGQRYRDRKRSPNDDGLTRPIVLRVQLGREPSRCGCHSEVRQSKVCEHAP